MRPLAVMCLPRVLDARLSDGGMVDAASTVGALRDLGWRVETVGFRRRHDGPPWEGVTQHAMPVAPRALSTVREPLLPLYAAGRSRPRGSRAATARDVLARADLVVAQGDLMLPFAARHAPAATPMVLRSENDEVAYLGSRARGERGAQRLLTAAERRRTPRLLQAARPRRHLVVALISPRDAGAYDDLGRPTFVVPPGLWDPASALPLREAAPEPVLLFVGSLEQAFNREGVLWFAEHVWPGVLERVPSARWVVAGRRPPEAFLRALPAQVEAVPDFDDLAALLAPARVMVNPVLHGTGLATKNGSAFAAGLPLVTTTAGARGMEAAAGEGFVVADDPAAQIDVVSRLLVDDAAWLAAAGAVRDSGSQVTRAACAAGWAEVLGALGLPHS